MNSVSFNLTSLSLTESSEIRALANYQELLGDAFMNDHLQHLPGLRGEGGEGGEGVRILSISPIAASQI